MTHEPAFGCRWAVIKEKQEDDPPIMAEDDEGSFVLYEHFVQLQATLAEREQVIARLKDDPDYRQCCELRRAAEKDVAQLNAVLRQAGWGQGEIDSAAYTFDQLEQANRCLVKERDAAVEIGRQNAVTYADAEAQLRARSDEAETERIEWVRRAERAERRVEELQARIVQLETEADATAWEVSPAMAQAAIDRLETENAILREQMQALARGLEGPHR